MASKFKFTGLTVKPEIYNEKDRHKRFLSKLRATRKDGTKTDSQDEHHSD